MFRCILCFVGWMFLLLAPTVRGEDGRTVELTVTGGKQDQVNVPIVGPITLDRDLKPNQVVIKDESGKILSAQLTAPGLLASTVNAGEGKFAKELHVLLPELKTGEKRRLKAVFTGAVPSLAKGFSWHSEKDEYTELRHGERPVLRYMHKPFDESTKENRELTYKVFHHLFDPSGKRLVTKGPGGLYPHHRGIYFGFNKITYGEGKKADTWHCTGGAHQSHVAVLASEAGPLLGRHRLEIAWHGENEEVFAREERELTVYNVPGGTMVDFAARLRTVGAPIELDGDPQHAGVQFRADNEVAAKTSKETIYVRPDGVGKAGEEWNWPQQKSQVNLPWKAMSFVLGGQRYTVANLDRPENPKESRFSERAYGRFGSYFQYQVTKEKPLEVRYRFWLQEGEMTPVEVARMAEAFAEPMGVVVK